jgi:hypothetical protein
MKNKIFYGIFIVTLLVVLGISVNKGLTNKSDISDLVLNNVEALAQSEDPVEVFSCNTQVIAICVVRYDKTFYGLRTS